MEETKATTAPAAESAPETPTPVPEAAPVVEEEVRADVLGDAAPAWMKKFDARGDSWEPQASDLENLSPEAQRVMNAMYRKSQEAAKAFAERESALDTRQRSLEDQTSSVSEERLRLYKLLQNDEVRKGVSPPEGEAPDPFSEEGIAYTVQAEVAKHLQVFWDKMDEGIKAQQAQHDEAKSAVWRTKRVTELKEFAKNNPDFKKHREQIKEIRTEMKNQISAEDAFRLIKARAGENVTSPKESNGVDESRSRARKATGRGRSTMAQQKGGPPKDATAIQVLQYYREHPEQMDHDYSKFKGRYN